MTRLKEEVALETEQRLQVIEQRDLTLTNYYKQEALLSHLNTINASTMTQLDRLHSVTTNISRDAIDLSNRLCSLQLSTT